MNNVIIHTVALLAVAATPAAAADPIPDTVGPATRPAAEATPDATAAQAEQVSIPFANHGGVRNWKAIDSHALLIEGPRGQWYRAELFGACIDLPYANAIGFLVEPTGELDRYSGIVVRDQVCRFKSLTKAENPYRKTGKGAPPPTPDTR
ncbi:DUF6491 family protein [Parapedomonas caeni]